MAKIGFIGLGNMGLPMAQNLIKAGHAVSGFDVSEYATERLATGGGARAASTAEACAGAETVITMLPAGDHVREVYLGAGGVLAAVAPGTLLVDSSTIDVATARAVAEAAAGNWLAMIDAPVSGGVAGAQAATLTFMVGGPDDAFARARPLLECMGKTIVHAGGALEIVGPMLVDDQLLPGAGAGAGLARQPRLQGGLHRRHDAQGPRAGAGRGARDPHQHTARCRRGGGLRSFRRKRRRRHRFFRDHPLPARRVIRAFSGKVGTGFPSENATTQKSWSAFGFLLKATAVSVNARLRRSLQLSVQSNIHRGK